ncbi:hypothetical protein [Bacillus sp. ISL-45]|uniref:hypothetical protein n=1 Tax=Bacillus sp. ISL-45 TaxID=2819128 RepID=UPI001BE71E90|nr:hypothetical protein [Bacillus sp. ISL-45]MBT2663877.1 hypothetical protein [Bacillus sp. ISL-45]
MLKLIIDNTYLGQTCRFKCDLFDDITEQCSIRKTNRIDDPETLCSCKYFIPKGWSETEKNYLQNNKLEQLQDGCNLDYKLYPEEPLEESKRDDAIWYKSLCGKYGCWIINHSSKKFFAVSNLSNGFVSGKGRRVYKSPFPLHDHKAPLVIASKVAWYVNEEGYGKYVLLNNGEIVNFSN